jgi:hypothetical protein
LSRWGKFSVSAFYSAGTLAVLVCTSTVASVLWCVMVGNHLGSDLRPVLVMCLIALLLIAAVTIANFILLGVRARSKTELE